LGQIYTWKALARDVTFSWTSQKTAVPPQGLFGGQPGMPGQWLLRPADGEEVFLPNAIGTAGLNYGDEVSCIMAGGGGYGDPLKRDIAAILEDVQTGLVSVESARSEYGVVINSESKEIDLEATHNLRQQLAKANEKKEEG
jgi:N-methylhydantoinase B